MTVGSNNIQDERSDVNNLWKWPDGIIDFDDTAHTSSPTKQFEPLFWTWEGHIATSGYAHVSRANWPAGDFAEDHVISQNISGYSMGIYVDLPSGKYTFSAISDIDPAFAFVEYAKLPNGKYQWSRIQVLRQRQDAGWFEIRFEVPEDTVIMIQFSPYESGNTKTDSPTMTVTDIKITEGWRS